MTPQEQNQRSYDMAAVALVRQGEPSTVRTRYGSTSCLYRSSRGRRCAAGWLFEGEAPEGPACTDPRISALLVKGGHNPHFVRKLQYAHDDSSALKSWLTNWQAEMRRVAKEHALSTAALDAALEARTKGDTALLERMFADASRLPE